MKTAIIKVAKHQQPNNSILTQLIAPYTKRLGKGSMMKPHIDKYFKYTVPVIPIEEHEVLITYRGKCYIARSVAEWKRQYLNEKGELRDPKSA